MIIPPKRSMFEAIETLEELQHLQNGLVIGHKIAVSLCWGYIDGFFDLGVDEGSLNIYIMYFLIEMSAQG